MNTGIDDTETGPSVWSRRRILRRGAVIGALAVAGCSESVSDNQSATTQSTRTQQTKNPQSSEFSIETLVSELTVPWDLAFGSRGDLYFTERPGRISVRTSDGTVTMLADIGDTAAEGEGGLLGLALHPSFPDPPAVFVYQTYDNNGLHNRILRYRRTDNRLERQSTLLDGIPGASIHDGGRLLFGPDGKLYATAGDSSQSELAQNTDSLAGKILRINPDGSIPSDNPFSGSPVWSYGHRNPEGLAWHPDSEQLFATEHGSSGHGEVNPIKPGHNYGWPVVSGITDGDRFTDPILESGESTWAPAGATVYTGDVFQAWRGNLFFVTLGFSPGEGRRSLHRVAFTGKSATEIDTHTRLLAGRFGRLRAVTTGPDGYVYITTSNRDGRGDPASEDDRILRLGPQKHENRHRQLYGKPSNTPDRSRKHLFDSELKLRNSGNGEVYNPSNRGRHNDRARTDAGG